MTEKSDVGPATGMKKPVFHHRLRAVNFSEVSLLDNQVKVHAHVGDQLQKTAQVPKGRGALANVPRTPEGLAALDTAIAASGFAAVAEEHGVSVSAVKKHRVRFPASLKQQQQQETPLQEATAEATDVNTNTLPNLIYGLDRDGSIGVVLWGKSAAWSLAPVDETIARARVPRDLAPLEPWQELMDRIHREEFHERNPWVEDFLPLCEGLALLPSGENKIPVDPANGRRLEGWQSYAFTVDEIRQLEDPTGAVRCLSYRTGPDSGNLISLDLDGDSASGWFRARDAEPNNAGWRTTRAADRQKAHYRLTAAQIHALEEACGEGGLRGKRTITTKEAPPGGKAEQVELFIASGQCVIAGQPSEGPPYKNHGSPQTVTEPDETTMQVLIELVKTAPKLEPRSGGLHISFESRQSGPDSPCPVCGRNTTRACTIWVSDEATPRLGVNCHHGQTFHPPTEIDMPGFDGGGKTLAKGDVVAGDGGGRWVFCRQGQNPDIGTFSTFLEDRPMEAAPSGQPTSVLEGGHFTILGWADGQREEICYRASRTQQIALFKCKARTELLRLAPLQHWIGVYGREQENQPRQAPADWDAAMSEVISQADCCGVFDRGLLRGHGVWLDRGRAVWHLGDRVEVDGEMRELDGIEGENHYERLHVLGVDPGVVALQNNEGVAVLNVLQGMGWTSPVDALHLAGWLVLANVGGALPKRPGLQLTSSSGSGKSDCVTEVIVPLLAGLAVYSSTSSEAGVRQSLKASSLPAVIDESEQENARKREAQLRLVRLSYDGVPQLMGTPSGESRSFAMRSSICLVGINATIPNVADRNRIVVISRQQIPLEKWETLARRRDELITRETGERLIRRTVSNLHTLLANVRIFGRVVARRYGGRAGDTYGALLAGAHHFTSLKVVDEAQAQQWMEDQRWELTDEALASSAAKNEAEQCLEHLLKHELPFNEANGADGISLADSKGMVSVRELVEYLTAVGGCWARGQGEDISKSAQRILGRYGLKVDRERGLLVATGEKGKLRDIYACTQWANGAFKERLLDLPGVERVPQNPRFPIIGTAAALSVPFSLISN